MATVDDGIDEASADVTAVLNDGRRVHVFVEHAIGSLHNPMSDATLEAQVPRPVGRQSSAPGQTGELIKACWAVGKVAPTCRPSSGLATPKG